MYQTFNMRIDLALRIRRAGDRDYRLWLRNDGTSTKILIARLTLPDGLLADPIESGLEFVEWPRLYPPKAI